jgi:NAD(P)-dependent dehydrogenase (short-subunit alcohol dehydrogenase family)
MSLPALEDIFNFKNKVVIVTGASQGVGRGIALRFSEAGAAVIIQYQTASEKAEQVAGAIRSWDGQALAVEADLSQETGAQAVVEAAVKTFGRLDILVNNTCVFPAVPLLELSPLDWDAVISANLRATFLCTQAAAKYLAAQNEGGNILNIAALEGTYPTENYAHYHAAKAGILQLTRTAARELGPFEIRVNAVCPGLIWRKGLKEEWPEGVAAWQKNTPLTRIGMPEDVADACLFLASEAARWITGVNLPVDGGASSVPMF